VMLAERWATRLAIGWGVAVTSSLLGLWASYRLDLPTGAAIVCTCGVLLAFVITGVSFRAPAPVTIDERAVDRRSVESVEVAHR
jgi:ABC-type Mn2+/Zn2+ transport system permease subunit